MGDRYRYLLGFTNILIFLVGAVFTVAGSLFKFTSGLLEQDVIKLFNKIKYEEIPLGLVGEGLAYIMIAYGGVSIFLVVLGLCGAYRKKKCCLISFASFLVFLMIIQLLIVGFWVFYRLRTDLWLRGRMLNSLKNYAGPTQTDLYSEGWNELFMKAQCCGVNDQFKDGGTNSDFTELPTTWTSGTDLVPATCCQGVTSGTITTYINSADCTTTPKNFYTEMEMSFCNFESNNIIRKNRIYNRTEAFLMAVSIHSYTSCQGVTSGTITTYINSADCTTTPKNFYTEGCYDRVSDTIKLYSLIVFITAAVAIVVQMAAIVFAILVVKHSNTKIDNRPSTSKSKPPPYVSGTSERRDRAVANWNAAGKAVKRNNYMDL